MNAALAPLDRIAHDMETTWGVGRLIGIVSPETAQRFGAAQRKLDLAIRANDVDTATAKAGVLIRGWRALNTEARNLGHTPDDIDVWCIRHPITDKPWAIVKHAADTIAAKRRFPDHTIALAADLLPAPAPAKRPAPDLAASQAFFNDAIPF